MNLSWCQISNHIKSVSVIAFSALAILLGTGHAAADNFHLGGTYNSVPMNIGNFGGGSIDVSVLNGKNLPFVYCLDLFINIGAPGNYPYTVVTNDGMVHGQAVNNAGEVAWLINHYAQPAETDVNLAIALQAAIWHVVWDNNGHGLIEMNPNTNANYVAMLAALGSNTDPVNTLLWISSNYGIGQILQGLVSVGAPEPGTYMALGSFLLIGALGLQRKKCKAHS